MTTDLSNETAAPIRYAYKASLIGSAHQFDLTDAGLGLIKRRILETTNKTLGKPLLKGVVFSEFSFVEQ